MRTRDKITAVSSAIRNDIRDLVTNTHPNYCPTIQPSTFSEYDSDRQKATEMANFAAQAFDSLAIIYGQDRRAFNHRNGSKAFVASLNRRDRKAGVK